MADELFRRRVLPHWDVPHAAYFLTSCLEGSIPAQGMLDIARYKEELDQQPRPADVSDRDWKIDRWKRQFARREKWLDGEPASRHLADPRLAQVVVDAMYHFAGDRYDLLAFAAMPSHFHWVFQPLKSWTSTFADSDDMRSARERIVHSINRYTAQQCNVLLHREGSFWQHESYDHWVRDADELERIIKYIENNPVKAGLVETGQDWLCSSACDRLRFGREFGEPLRRGAGFQPAR